MRRKRDRGPLGNEAPMIITPRALVRVLAQVVGGVRRLRSRRSR